VYLFAVFEPISRKEGRFIEADASMLYHNFKHYVAGRYYFPQNFIGTGSAGTVAAGRLYAVPIGVSGSTETKSYGKSATVGEHREQETPEKKLLRERY
jgi:hypothetical protein